MAKFINQIETDKELTASALGATFTFVVAGVTYNATIKGVGAVADVVVTGTFPVVITATQANITGSAKLG